MTDASTASRASRRSRNRLVMLALLVVAILAIIFEPTGIVRGRLLGEVFFLNRPEGYWETQFLAGPAERSGAREQFAAAGQAGVPVLIELLGQSDSNEVRWTAAEILGELGPDANAASDALIAALHDADPYVQSVAAEVLPNVGTTAEAAVPALAELLEGEHAPVAARSISFYKAQAEPALPQLVAVLADTSRTTEARWNAARTIGKTGPPAIDTLPTLVEMCRDSEATVRGNAAEAIGDIGPTAAAGVPALIESLQDPVARVRHHAVRSLGYIGPAAIDAVPAIEPLLEDPDATVRDEAKKAIEVIAPADEAPSAP